MLSSHERCMSELQKLGLTALEATIYLYLTRHPRITGYRVARELGKPTANVYSALESLRKKGAVAFDQGTNRVSRALPPETLVHVFEERFQDRARRLAHALGQLNSGEDDPGVYQLTEPEQVFAHARSMLRNAKAVALLDLFPVPLAKLKAEIQRAAARGISIAAQVYEPVSFRGIEVVISHRAREVIGRWPGQWLTLVTDGSEYLGALLFEDGGGVHHSTWTKSPHLTWTHHSALSGDLIATRLMAALEAGESAKSVRALARRLEQRLRPPEPAGYQRLLREVRAPHTRKAV